jgi:hypothetical protein
VEPSRNFSFKLKELMRGDNIYGGAVGVYWTEGIGKLYWTPDKLMDKPEDLICKKIESALNAKKIRRNLTWENLQSLQKFEQIKKIREEYILREKNLQTVHGDIRTGLDRLEKDKKYLEEILDVASQEIAGKEALLKEAEEKNKELEKRLLRLTHTPSRSYNEGIINSSRKLIILPNISCGVSSSQMQLPDVLVICCPLVPEISGVERTNFSRFFIFFCSSLPISMLNVWSVPPISKSTSISTES